MGRGTKRPVWRRPAIALGMVLLGGGIALFVQPRRVAEMASTETEKTPPPGDPQGLVDPVLHASTGAEAGRAPLTATGTAQEPADGSPGLTLQGQVTLTDIPSGRRDMPDGTLLVTVSTVDAQEDREVTVHDGRFTIPIRPGSAALASEVEIDTGGFFAQGRAGFTPQEPEVDPSGLLIVDGVWGYDALIHVVEAGTGAELDGVRVATGWANDSPPRSPTPEGLIMDGETSPIRLVANPRTWIRRGRTYWVRARDTEWKRLTIDHALPVETTLYLPTAGNLLVEIVNHRPDPRAILELERIEDGQPVSYEKVGSLKDGDRLELLALKQGNWLLKARIRDASISGLTLGRLQIEVRPGETSKASLVLDPLPPRPEQVPFRGTLILHEDWPLEFSGGGPPGVVHLFFSHVIPSVWPDWCSVRKFRSEEGIASVEVEAGSQRVFAFDAGTVIPGPLELRIKMGSFNWPRLTAVLPFELGTSGNEHARIEIPAPTTLRVFLRDALSGTALPPDEVSFTWFAREGDRRPSRFVRWTGTSDEFVSMVLPPLPGRMDVALDGYGDQSLSLDGKPGPRDVTLELTPAPAATVHLLANGLAVPVPRTWRVDLKVEHLDRDWTVWGGSWDHEDSSVIELFLDHPGRHRLHVPPLAGFDPVAPVEFDAQPGEPTRLEIRLVRTP